MLKDSIANLLGCACLGVSCKYQIIPCRNDIKRLTVHKAMQIVSASILPFASRNFLHYKWNSVFLKLSNSITHFSAVRNPANAPTF